MKKAGLIACALAVLVMCGCDGAFGKYEVVYKAWGSASNVEVYYYNSGETPTTTYGLPFNYEFRTGNGDQMINIQATRENAALGTEVHVELWVNGKLLAEDSDKVTSGSGDYLLAMTGIHFPSEADSL